MVYHGMPWYTMVYHGKPWYTMVYLGVPWYTMVYHGTPWYTMVWLDAFCKQAASPSMDLAPTGPARFLTVASSGECPIIASLSNRVRLQWWYTTDTMVYHGIPWHTMVYHGIPWYTNYTPWYTMVYHDIPWYTVVYHGIPRFSIVYHGIPWYTMDHWYTMVSCSR